MLGQGAYALKWSKGVIGLPLVLLNPGALREAAMGQGFRAGRGFSQKIVVSSHVGNGRGLTTPHKLQGGGTFGKPGAAEMGCLGLEKTDGRALSASCGSYAASTRLSA